MGIATANERPAVSTGYNRVKGFIARRAKRGQVLVFMKNQKYNGPIVQMEAETVFHKLREKLMGDVEAVDNAINTEEDKDKRIMLKSAMKNILESEIWITFPRFGKMREEKVAGVVELLGMRITEAENKYLTPIIKEYANGK